jgi:hypothetical protein
VKSSTSSTHMELKKYLAKDHHKLRTPDKRGYGFKKFLVNI